MVSPGGSRISNALAEPRDRRWLEWSLTYGRTASVTKDSSVRSLHSPTRRVPPTPFTASTAALLSSRNEDRRHPRAVDDGWRCHGRQGHHACTNVAAPGDAIPDHTCDPAPNDYCDSCSDYCSHSGADRIEDPDGLHQRVGRWGCHLLHSRTSLQRLRRRTGRLPLPDPRR